MAIKALNEILSLIELILNVEITEFVCQILEKAIKSNKKKINKQEGPCY
jgi:hypothetical protein